MTETGAKSPEQTASNQVYNETDAMRTCHRALWPLTHAQRIRVLGWIEGALYDDQAGAGPAGEDSF